MALSEFVFPINFIYDGSMVFMTGKEKIHLQSRLLHRKSILSREDVAGIVPVVVGNFHHGDRSISIQVKSNCALQRR